MGEYNQDSKKCQKSLSLMLTAGGSYNATDIDEQVHEVLYLLNLCYAIEQFHSARIEAAQHHKGIRILTRRSEDTNT